MNAIERINELKTIRREELEREKKATRERLAAEEAERSADLKRAYTQTLIDAGAPELVEFVSGTKTCEEEWSADVHFAIPGHALIGLHMVCMGNERWVSMSQCNKPGLNWFLAKPMATTRLTHFETLADVLLAAEGDEPIPF